jgi:hypothetical protein
MELGWSQTGFMPNFLHVLIIPAEYDPDLT